MTKSTKKVAKNSSDLDVLIDLFVQCWKKPQLKEQLLDKPKEVLQMWGLLPYDVKEVQVVEESPGQLYFVLPACPNELKGESQEVLLVRARQESSRGWKDLYIKVQNEGLWEIFAHRYWP